MNNRLGLDEYNFEIVEKELVKIKLNIINELFTFNQQIFNLDFLKNINEFLFRDLYFDCDLGLRNLTDVEIKLIESKLELIIDICMFRPKNIKQILDLVSELWYIQPFNTGNTRTLLGFIKVLSSAFLLNIEIDLDKNIKSNSGMFELNNIVNQKTLTKNK